MNEKFAEEIIHSHVKGTMTQNGQDMKSIYMSINRWMEKEKLLYSIIFYIYYIMEYYSAITIWDPVILKKED